MRQFELESIQQQKRFYEEHKGEKCVAMGSYGQECVDELDAQGKNYPDFDPSPHLAWHDKFLCYNQYASCKKTSAGVCGWVDGGGLSNCLKNPKKFLKPTPEMKY